MREINVALVEANNEHREWEIFFRRCSRLGAAFYSIQPGALRGIILHRLTPRAIRDMPGRMRSGCGVDKCSADDNSLRP
jgi:hypothetical protein